MTEEVKTPTEINPFDAGLFNTAEPGAPEATEPVTMDAMGNFQETPEVPEATETPEQVEPDPRDVKIADLEDKLGVLMTLIQDKGATPEPPKTQEVPVTPPDQSTVKIQELPFITKDNFESFAASPEALNSKFNEVYARTIESMMAVVPAVVEKQVAVKVEQTLAIREFFTQNPDLNKEEYKQTLAKVVSTLQRTNPAVASDTQKLFAETARQARILLNLKSAVKEPLKPITNAKPALPNVQNKINVKQKMTNPFMLGLGE